MKTRRSPYAILQGGNQRVARARRITRDQRWRRSQA
jgi:hypothetical protein